MATLRVLPIKDGVNQRSSWAVEKSGARVSTHVKKSAAKRTARQKASEGDTLVVHRTDGTIQSTTTVSSSKGGRSSSTSKTQGGGRPGGLPGYGRQTFERGISDAFDY